jgi:hypothetical protein
MKGLDDQAQVSKYVCLIIKSLDTQAQKLNNQINQYPKKSLILTLGPHTKARTETSEIPKSVHTMKIFLTKVDVARTQLVSLFFFLSHDRSSPDCIEIIPEQ